MLLPYKMNAIKLINPAVSFNDVATCVEDTGRGSNDLVNLWNRETEKRQTTINDYKASRRSSCRKVAKLNWLSHICGW